MSGGGRGTRDRGARYRGEIDSEGRTRVLRPDGSTLPLAPSRAWLNHRSTGFEWGHVGSGPAQLALALILDVTGDPDTAREAHQALMWTKVARWPQGEPWAVTDGELRAWLAANRSGGWRLGTAIGGEGDDPLDVVLYLVPANPATGRVDVRAILPATMVRECLDEGDGGPLAAVIARALLRNLMTTTPDPVRRAAKEAAAVLDAGLATAAGARAAPARERAKAP